METISKNTKKILYHLLRNLPDKNINQIARELEISVGSAFKILKKLEKDRIISVKEMGNARYHRLNLRNPETIKLCELLLLEEKRALGGYAKIYSDEIEKFKDAELIMVFGSVLKNKKFNDVDILFLTGKVKKVSDFCLEMSKTKSKPVSPLILKKQDLINEIKEGRDSILDIIKTGVVLRGESVFVEVIRNVKSQG